MPEPVATLTIAITTRALFHLEDSHALFEREGIAAFAEHQRRHEDDVLEPGIAFPLVRKLLALNAGAPAGAPRVEVILLSRNSSDTGLRVFNSIQQHGLDIRRATFTAGAPVWPYIKPFGAQLFLSANPDSVRNALEAGVAAATILPARAGVSRHDQLRIAFDGDAVIFGDESERVSREQGVEAFGRHAAGGVPGRRRCTDPHRAGHRALRARARTGDPHIARMGGAPGRGAVPRWARQGPVPGSVRRRHLLRRLAAQHRFRAPPRRRRPRAARRGQRRRLKVDHSGRRIPVSFQARPLRLNSNTTGRPSAFCTVAVNSEGDS